MSAQIPPPLVPLSPAARPPRIEYLGFQNVGENREFRLRVCAPDGPIELRFGIALAAFADGRIRSQDGPDICYQKLLRAIATGETQSFDGITLDDVDLLSYREAHTKVQKRRRPATTEAPIAVVAAPPVVRRHRPERTPPPPPAVKGDAEPGLVQGQRVSHAAYGVGVTTSSARGRTVVCFDEHGSKTFITSMVKMDVLSGPHTWETGPRGKNRPVVRS